MLGVDKRFLKYIAAIFVGLIIGGIIGATSSPVEITKTISVSETLTEKETTTLLVTKTVTQTITVTSTPTPTEPLIICPQDESLYVWTPIESKSENFIWKCLHNGYTWNQTYPDEFYQRWKKAFLEPDFVRDYMLLYLLDIGYDLPDPLRSEWTGGRITPAGTVGAETHEYITGELVVTIKYPVVLPENTQYGCPL